MLVNSWSAAAEMWDYMEENDIARWVALVTAATAAAAPPRCCW
jgi:hypothetical protein